MCTCTHWQDRAIRGDSENSLLFTVPVPVHALGDVSIVVDTDADSASTVPGFFYPPSATVVVPKGKCAPSNVKFTARPAVFVTGKVNPEVSSVCLSRSVALALVPLFSPLFFPSPLPSLLSPVQQQLSTAGLTHFCCVPS